jgi:hypothetical protein
VPQSCRQILFRLASTVSGQLTSKLEESDIRTAVFLSDKALKTVETETNSKILGQVSTPLLNIEKRI